MPTIIEITRLLNEYNKNGSKLTTIAGSGGDKASGKSYDRIAAGVAKPYQNKVKKLTKNEKLYPNLGKLIRKMKEDSIGGNKIVIGAALNELKNLEQTIPLRTDENGDKILPFGENVRLTKKGNNYFVKLYSTDDTEPSKTQQDITNSPLPII